MVWKYPAPTVLTRAMTFCAGRPFAGSTSNLFSAAPMLSGTMPTKLTGANSRERRHPIAQLREELHGLVVRVVLDLRVHGHDEEVGGLESNVDGGGIAEAAEKKSGGGEEHEGERDLDHHQGIAHAGTGGASERRRGHL